MAKCKFTLCKKSALKRALSKAPAAAGTFILIDNEDLSFTVSGADAAGNPAAIDPTLVTLTVTSDTPAVLSVDPPTGLTFNTHALTPGTANLTVTVTWNDGSIGPFTATVPEVVSAGPVSGLIVTPGTPVARP